MTRTKRTMQTGGPTMRIDILDSQQPWATEGIRWPTHTASCNVITAHNICVPYPNQTLQMEYAPSTWSFLSEDKKITLATMKLKETSVDRIATRRIFDKKCLMVCIDDSGYDREKREPLDGGLSIQL